MGQVGSMGIVPSDYKIKYVDSLIPSNIAGLGEQFRSNEARTIRVKIAKDVIEDIYCEDADLTVGWLLSEVSRRYDERFEHSAAKDRDNKYSKKLIVGLKSCELLPALDYYLTHLDNCLRPIRHSSVLAVHYSKLRDGETYASRRSQSCDVGKDDFQFLRVIGCGGYANVVLARKNDSGRLYAVKVIKKDSVFASTPKSVYSNEAQIMRRLTGMPFIVGLNYTFQTDTELYFVMQPCIGGTLFHMLTHLARGDMGGEAIKFYMAEIVIALEKIHSKNIMYRDLKPENILIDIDGHIKLSDFGLSKQNRRRDDLSSTFCGSPEYLPPEMLLGYDHSRAVDFYTLGCLLYEMIVGFPPFHASTKKNLDKRIVGGVVRFPNDISDDARDLIEWLLSKNPADRPEEFSDVKRHSYFKNVHWGRVAMKQAIPPWVPDLYKWHVPKKFSSVPVAQVFLDVKRPNKAKSPSCNPWPNEHIGAPDIASDPNSNRVVKSNLHIQSRDNMSRLHVKDFDHKVQSAEEDHIQKQILFHLQKKALAARSKPSEAKTAASSRPCQASDGGYSSEGCVSIESDASQRNTVSKYFSAANSKNLDIDWSTGIGRLNHPIILSSALPCTFKGNDLSKIRNVSPLRLRGVQP